MSEVIRLTYVFIGGVLKQKSVQHKISCQVNELNAHGIDARGIFFTTLMGEEGSAPYNDQIDQVPLPAYTKKHNYFQNYHEAQFHYAYIAEYLKQTEADSDILFLRHNGNGPGYEAILDIIAHKAVVYIPSNRIREAYCERIYTKDASLGSALFSWYAYLRFWKNEKRFLTKWTAKLKAVVTFTPEFGRIVSNYASKPVSIIYNRDGVHTAGVPHRRCLERSGKAIKLIFLKGSNQEQKWAGLDRLIRSIEAAPEIPVELYITGNADKFPERYGRDFVTLTGRLPFEELEQLIDEVDLGVSNLQNYLIHFNETTNLKSRDYYSRGLPFIQSNTMPDIEGTDAAQYYKQVPNDDSLIDMAAVHQFAMNMRAKVDHPKRMHDFAVQHLDWNVTAGELAASIKKI